MLQFVPIKQLLKLCNVTYLHLYFSVVFVFCFFLSFDSEELDKFMESQGASILTLTTSLSKPFMRLDKYPTLLQELERHVEVLEGKKSFFVYILR